MSPMCLLTMSVDTLHAASEHAAQSSPHGERGERYFTRVLVLLLLAMLLALPLLL